MTESKTNNRNHLFLFFSEYRYHSRAELQPFRSYQRASSPLPRLIFLLCFTCKTRCCRDKKKKKKGKKDGECTGETKMRAGDGVAHVAIWVFPASSSRFGTEFVLFFCFFFLTPLPPSLPLFLACHVCSAYPCFIYRSLH